jgi:hypothetical protein
MRPVNHFMALCAQFDLFNPVSADTEHVLDQ